MAPSISPSSIPFISALRKKLGYGDSRSEHCQSILFYDSVRTFRKTFVSSQGHESSAVHDWKSSENQRALDEMVQAYLDRDGNGPRLWPDESVQNWVNKLKYSVHETKIKRILKQLFWRMNLQQHQYLKYKKSKEKTDKTDTRTLDGRGLSHEDPIDVDEFEKPLANSNAAETPGTSSSTKTDKPPASPKVIEPAFHPGSDQAPEGYDQQAENTSLNYHTFAAMSSAGPNEDRQFAPYAEMNPSEPPAKRQKVDNIESSDQKSKEKRDKTPTDIRTSRVSPRKRKIPQRDGFATAEQLSAIDDNYPSEIDNAAISSEAHLEASGGSFTGARGGPDVRARVDSVEDFADETIVQQNTEIEMHSPRPDEDVNSPEASAPVDPSRQATPGVDRKKAVSSLADMRRSETMAPEPVESFNLPQTASLRQARVKFVYRIITRYPSRRSCIWKPKGSFRTKTLAELEDELPLQFERSKLQHLLLRMEARDTHAEQMILCGREDEFDALKRHLADFIRDCIAESIPGEEVSVFIDIEPLSTSDSTEKSSEVEHIAFEW
ncbi:hypothetical protein BDP55DRAFT_662195 [Colletotrichum godetiae]|uniref:Uncharacterized protein n=1 Tax=Colletotrichum godetiae TaxID=1209918 RepID=A0AAJ0ALV5_9PEZI|nr:uncharacterized protein BDP55DRAFT_662195 [Colletotrichum godetiae]KAK1676287.1 hypothetical protein BDP55DRAFT_662195 [Colletotrichum godetiae]